MLWLRKRARLSLGTAGSFRKISDGKFPGNKGVSQRNKRREIYYRTEGNIQPCQIVPGRDIPSRTFLRATTGGKGSKGGRKGRSKEAKQAAAQQTAAEVRYATEFQEALENGGALPNYVMTDAENALT